MPDGGCGKPILAGSYVLVIISWTVLCLDRLIDKYGLAPGADKVAVGGDALARLTVE